MKKAAGTVEQAIPTAGASPQVSQKGKRSLPLLNQAIKEETVNQSTSDHILESSTSAPQPNLSVSHFPELFVNFFLPVRSPKMRDADGVKTALPAVH